MIGKNTIKNKLLEERMIEIKIHNGREQWKPKGGVIKLCQGLFLTFIPTPCWGHAPSREAFSAAKLHNFKSISKFYCQLL